MARNSRKLQALLLVIVAVCQLHAGAAAQAEVETELVAEVRQRVRTAPDRETFRYVPATVLTQGEVVYYTVRISNLTAELARNVLVTQRVPANTAYIPGSAAAPGAEVTFSMDGGQTFVPADQLIANMDARVQPVQAEQCTHIRWQLRNPLAAGAVALARFRAVFR